MNHGPKEPSLAQPALPGCSGRGRGLGPAPAYTSRGQRRAGLGPKGMLTITAPGSGDGGARSVHCAGPEGTGALSHHSIRLEGMEKRGLIIALAPTGRGERCRDSAD